MTIDYKQIARAYVMAVNNYDESTIREMVTKDYIQHNPNVPTGREAFISFLPKLKEYQSKIENFRMLSDGKYIIMHHQWHNAEPFGATDMVAFHIILFDDAGKIAEHWNVISQSSTIAGPRDITDLNKTQANKELIIEKFMNLDGKQHVVFGEGNFILSISESNQIASYDLYNIIKGNPVNHWSVQQEVPTENLANTNTMFNFQTY
jgi:predicted SnoaL-like aldol condensation-catalyzing enzyme